MPYWWVSPQINLRLEDEPLGYQPALGPRISFQLSYRQRLTVPEDPTIFGVGTNWSTSFRSYLYAPGNNFGAFEVYLHTGGAGYLAYDQNSAQTRDGSLLTQITGGCQIAYPDGSIAIYTNSFTDTNGDNLLFMTSRTDPAGNTVSYSYVTNAGVFQLNAVTDADGHATTLYYQNATFPSLITMVVDPFSRTNRLTYDGQGFLTNVVDVQGITNSFAYDYAGGRAWITNLTTPYGNTGFSFGGLDATNDDMTSTSGVNRYALVTLPTGGKYLYLFQINCAGFLSSWSPPIPNTTPFANTFNTVSDLKNNNSFDWNPQQYAALSTTNPMALAASDYGLGTLCHWLSNGHGITPALGLKRAPSPDGTTVGSCTWYDFEGKGTTDSEGNSDFPSFVARVQPDSSTTFTYSLRNQYLKVVTNISTYTLAGSVAFRTNQFIYADNAIDLLQWVGPNQEQVVSNYFVTGNNTHEPNSGFDALGQKTDYTYNGYGQVTSIKTPAGLTTTNIYFSSGASANRLSTTIDLEILRTNSYAYYANGLVDTHTDERNLVTTQYWDNLQRQIGVAYPDGTTTSNVYTILDVTGVKDRLGNWDNFGYNAIRQRITATNANGAVTLYNYCQCGLLYAVTNAFNTSAQMVTSYDYHYDGNRWHTYLPDMTITNYYDALGRVSATCDPWGCRWFGYNNQGLLTGITNNAGVENETVFDIEDRPIDVTDANQVTVTNTYDVLGRLSSRTYPDGGAEGFAYSARGLVVYTNQLYMTNFYAYDVAGRKIIETNANGEILLFTNNAAGDLLSLTDAKNQTTRWNYDQYGRATNKLDQAGTVVLTYQYDADNRLTNRWSVAKLNTRYKYDNVGNLTVIDYSGGATPPTFNVTNSYDALNRLTNMVDGLGVTKYTYTSGGFLYTEDGPFASDTVTNLYSNRLRVGLGLQQPTGFWTNGFAYDDAKRLTNVTSPAGAFGYAYDVLRLTLPAAIRLPNTSYITNVYDVNARLLSTMLNNSSGATLDAAMYGYNVANQRTNFANAAGTNVLYNYDPIGQLTVATSSISAENRGYKYDAAWNLNDRTNNGVNTAFSVDGKNQLTTVGITNFLYDSNGNMTNWSWTSGAHGGSTTNFYDVENRLIAVQTLSNTVPIQTTFVYDGLSRLRQQLWWTNSSGSGGGGAPPPTGGGSTNWTLVGGIEYIYDGKRVIQERDYNNNPLVSYTRGNDLSGTLEGAGGIGGLLARSDGYSSGNFTDHNFYHADGNGNITYLVNSSQTLAASYRYDPFGNLITSSGSLAVSNTYRFSSKEFVSSVGLYYYLYRFYDPGLQRWLNRDPIAEDGGLNTFAFVENDPITFSDPFGDQPYPPVVIVPRTCPGPTLCPCWVACTRGKVTTHGIRGPKGGVVIYSADYSCTDCVGNVTTEHHTETVVRVGNMIIGTVPPRDYSYTKWVPCGGSGA
jgi:RHS repeat-associated protein